MLTTRPTYDCIPSGRSAPSHELFPANTTGETNKRVPGREPATETSGARHETREAASWVAEVVEIDGVWR